MGSSTAQGEIDAAKLVAGQITAGAIDAGHIAICLINIKTGKRGVKHLYSDGYRAKWPQETYPEKYEADVPTDG